jgi:hypothetical protein
MDGGPNKVKFHSRPWAHDEEGLRRSLRSIHRCLSGAAASSGVETNDPPRSEKGPEKEKGETGAAKGTAKEKGEKGTAKEKGEKGTAKGTETSDGEGEDAGVSGNGKGNGKSLPKKVVSEAEKARRKAVTSLGAKLTKLKAEYHEVIDLAGSIEEKVKQVDSWKSFDTESFAGVLTKAKIALSTDHSGK